MAIQVRKSTYRGDDGFLICGTNRFGHDLKVFTHTKNGAERIRNAYNDSTMTMKECWEVTSRVLNDEALDRHEREVAELSLIMGEY